MILKRRFILFVLLSLISLNFSGCVAYGSSFETLGVPTVDQQAGKGTVILGWALENRSNWMLKRVRINEETRLEWNAETQAPVIIYIDPGLHEFRLSMVQESDPGRSTSRPKRRYRLRPFQVAIQENEARLCNIRITEGRNRPVVECELISDQNNMESQPESVQPELSEETSADIAAPSDSQEEFQQTESQQEPVGSQGLPQTSFSVEDRIERLERQVQQLLEQRQ